MTQWKLIICFDSEMKRQFWFRRKAANPGNSEDLLFSQLFEYFYQTRSQNVQIGKIVINPFIRLFFVELRKIWWQLSGVVI